jgi:exodeoxyribonuclease VII small subunit
VSRKAFRFNFEKAITELEHLVTTMETGTLSLEEALQAFERGIVLTRACQQALTEAETKISVLLEKDGQSVLEPFFVPLEQQEET